MTTQIETANQSPFDAMMASVQATIASLDPAAGVAKLMEPTDFEVYAAAQVAKAQLEAKDPLKKAVAKARLEHLQAQATIAKAHWEGGGAASITMFKDPYQADTTETTVKPAEIPGSSSPFSNSELTFKALADAVAALQVEVSKVVKGDVSGKVAVSKASVANVVKATGAAAQKLAEVLASLGVTPTEKDSFWAVAGKVEDALKALHQAATVELILGGGGAPAPQAAAPTEEVVASRDGSTPAPVVPAPEATAKSDRSIVAEAKDSEGWPSDLAHKEKVAKGAAPAVDSKWGNDPWLAPKK